MGFQSGYRILNFPRQSVRTTVFLQSHQHLILSAFLNLGYCNRSVVVSYCGFNSDFAND